MKQVGFCQAVEILGNGTIAGESITEKLKQPGPTPLAHYIELMKYARKLLKNLNKNYSQNNL